MSTSPMRCRARSPPARARCWWSTPARASRRRRWPTSTRRSTTTTRSSPVLNKIDLPAAEPERIKRADRGGDRPRRLRRRADLGQDRPRHPRGAGGHRPPPAAAARATPTAPLKALLVDSWYDAYLGVVVLVRVIDGVLQEGPDHPHDAAPAPATWSSASASSRPSTIDVDELGPGEIGFITGSIKEVADTARRRHHHRGPPPDRAGAARLQAGAAGGVLRPVPGRRRRFRGPARRDRQAAPQRRQLLLRDGDQRRARLRLPLRLPRPAAPGDHPGAAGARVRPRPDRHRALASSTASA